MGLVGELFLFGYILLSIWLVYVMSFGAKDTWDKDASFVKRILRFICLSIFIWVPLLVPMCN